LDVWLQGLSGSLRVEGREPKAVSASEAAVRRLIAFWVLFALILLGIGRLLAQDDDRREIEAQVGATYQEADEGYFSFGQDAMVVAKQGSDLQKWLKAHVGQRMKVKFEVEKDK
jgi:hypothetical protein